MADLCGQQDVGLGLNEWSGKLPMTEDDPNLGAMFISQVRGRSRENQAAFGILWQQRLLSPAVALVRQELDSMVRVMFLLMPHPQAACA